MNQITYTLNATDKKVRMGNMPEVAGENPRGETYGFNNFYMLQNGKPFIPVVGEFHFARFSYLQWEEELLKMKAGGVHIIASYIFWIFHEEEEGKFEWGGNRNLRHFIDLCAKCELPLILRIGPFCHGEVRNGGIPDWVFSKPIEVRSNDAGYLKHAARLYGQIAKQMKGTLFQEGGPVIAVQLENEYMHCGAPLDAWGYKAGKYIPSGSDGNEHLAELRRIAEEAGIKPMFFTVTAWGGAAVPEKDTLPMLAGYAYTPWVSNQPPSREFVFRDLHMTPSEPVNYDCLNYPVAYCEMAGGMQVSYNARPFVPAESIEAMTLVKLASGSNLVGYYMYHGGSNPIGKHTYLNESFLPKITYDYQSPLGEFGRVAASYDRIRNISLFLESFGELLAPMGTVLPEGQSEIASEDVATLRWCMRQQGGAGFVFMNNFQDHIEMPDREVKLTITTSRGDVHFPSEGAMVLKGGTGLMLPFHINLHGVEIISSTAPLLSKLEDDQAQTIIFYAPEGVANPEIIISEQSVAAVNAGQGTALEVNGQWIIKPAIGKEHHVCLTKDSGEKVNLLILSREEALAAYRFTIWGKERLVISNSHLIVKDERIVCTSPENNVIQLAIYPACQDEVVSAYGETTAQANGLFQSVDVELPKYKPNVQLKELNERITLTSVDTNWPEHIEDVFLEIDYDGDVAAAHLNDRLLTDHIHYGDTWHIGLKDSRLELAEHALQLSITPLRKGTVHSFVNQAFVERFEGVEIAQFHRIEAIPYYSTSVYRKIKRL